MAQLLGAPPGGLSLARPPSPGSPHLWASGRLWACSCRRVRMKIWPHSVHSFRAVSSLLMDCGFRSSRLLLGWGRRLREGSHRIRHHLLGGWRRQRLGAAHRPGQQAAHDSGWSGANTLQGV